MSYLRRGLNAPQRNLTQCSMLTVIYQSDILFPVYRNDWRKWQEKTVIQMTVIKRWVSFYFALSGSCLLFGKPSQVRASLNPARKKIIFLLFLHCKRQAWGTRYFSSLIYQKKKGMFVSQGPGKRGRIVAYDVSWAAQTGKHLLRTQNVSEQNQKQFLCPGHKICVRNKCCARGQTGKHLCPQQCVRNNVSSFARAFR